MKQPGVWLSLWYSCLYIYLLEGLALPLAIGVSAAPHSTPFLLKTNQGCTVHTQPLRLEKGCGLAGESHGHCTEMAISSKRRLTSLDTVTFASKVNEGQNYRMQRCWASAAPDRGRAHRPVWSPWASQIPSPQVCPCSQFFHPISASKRTRPLQPLTIGFPAIGPSSGLA